MLAQITVDLGAIRANIAALQRLVGPARVAGVIKSNAYGHGLVPVAQALAPLADRLCVYELNEAIALRDAGVTARIHVLGPLAAHAANVEITLWDDGAYAAAVARVANEREAPFALHAKIDTGVTRLGMRAADAPQLLERYRAQSGFRIAGVFSHLAAAEELDSTYTEEQLRRFLEATAAFDPAVERHIAASAAAMLWPQTRLGAIRAGIALYGIWPSPQTETIMRERGLALKPA